MTSFFFGGISCMIAALITHPIDTLKVRRQIQSFPSQKSFSPYYPESVPRPRKQYPNSLVGGASIQNLWQGLSASLLREATYSTVRIGFYEPIKNLLTRDGKDTLTLGGKIIAGGISGLIGSTFSTPADLLKASMATNPKGLFQTAKELYQSHGFSGLYRGVLPNSTRAVILTATQLSSYDETKSQIVSSRFLNLNEGVAAHTLASIVSGFCCACTSNPVDVIKSRYMNQELTRSGHGVLYSSAFDCAIKTWKGEGIRGFYKGWTANWARIAPHTLITFLVLERLRFWSGLKPV